MISITSSGSREPSWLYNTSSSSRFLKVNFWPRLSSSLFLMETYGDVFLCTDPAEKSESILSFHLITSIHPLKALTTTPFMKKAWKSFLIYNIPWEGDCWIVIIRSSGSVSVSDIKRDWFRMTMVWPCSSMTCSPKITGDSSFTGWSSGKTSYDDGETCRI